MGYRNVAFNLRLRTAAARELGVDTHVCEVQLLLRPFAELKVVPNQHPPHTRTHAHARAHTPTHCVCVCVRVCVCVCVCVWNIGEALTYLSNIPCTLAQPITKSVVEGMLLAASDLGDLHSCTCTAGVESYLKCEVQRYYCTHNPTFPTSPAQINAEPQ